MWVNGAVFTNPGGGQVLADSGIIPGGVYEVSVIIQHSVQAIVFLERRNVADTVTLQNFKMRLATGFYTSPPLTGIEIINGERLRVSLNAGITGEIEADIFLILRQDLLRVR